MPLIEEETLQYIETSKHFKGSSGTVNIPPVMAEITIFTAARTLQGEEVRAQLNSTFAKLYHDLDLGFSPINFMMPWAPLPRNRKRDAAQVKMRGVYMDIIKARRQGAKEETDDMISNLMRCSYKNGMPIPDKEIAHMMITILMAGQHSSSAISAWVMLRLAAHPEIMEELYQEQKRELGEDLPPLRYEHMQKLSLNNQVVKETLRRHNAIHSLMRKVKNPLPIKGTNYVIPTSHTLLASTGVTAQSNEHFKSPETWDPHRWDAKVELEDEETVDYGYGNVSKGTKSPYLPFGAGRHRCIGEQFAYVNLGVIVAVMVRELVFKNVDGKKGVVDTDYSVRFLSVPKAISGPPFRVTNMHAVPLLTTLGASTDSLGASAAQGGLNRLYHSPCAKCWCNGWRQIASSPDQSSRAHHNAARRFLGAFHKSSSPIPAP